MSYAKMTDVARGIAAEIEQTERFKRVTWLPATNGSQVVDLLEGVANLPCAVVCIGNADFDEKGVRRTIRPLILVADKFQRGAAATAAGVWALVETVEELFRVETDPGPPRYHEIAGIPFHVAGWTPVESDDLIAAYAITLEGVEFL